MRGRLTLVDVALNHDTHDTSLALLKLLRDFGGDLGLVLVVLARVAVAAVNHQALAQAALLKRGLSLGNALRIVVGAFGTATKDNEAVLVANGSDNGNDTGLGDGQEVMGVTDSTNGINGDTKGTVSTVLEADGERETASQLAVKLGLGGASANSANAQHIGKELRADGIQHLAGKGHALGSKVDEQLSAEAQALVDLEAVVDIGVVDQALPANRRPGLLEVGSHDDQQLILVLLLLLEQHIAVLEGGLGVVDGARADDY